MSPEFIKVLESTTSRVYNLHAYLDHKPANYYTDQCHSLSYFSLDMQKVYALLAALLPSVGSPLDTRVHKILSTESLRSSLNPGLSENRSCLLSSQ